MSDERKVKAEELTEQLTDELRDFLLAQFTFLVQF